MPMKSTRALLTMALLTAEIGFGAASPLEERLVTTFLGALKSAVSRDDRRAVAAMIHYPMTVQVENMRIPIADSDALIQNYEAVFSASMKAVIAQAAIATAGRPAPIYRVTIGDAAATIGSDLIQLQLLDGSLKITRIIQPQAVSEDGRVQRPATRAARRIAFSVGQAQLSGALAANDTDSYVLSAARNQLIEVRINGVSGRDIVAHIVNARSGVAVDVRARDGARVWSGRVPDEGEYRVDVVRPAGSGEARLPYILIVSMR